jgi:hypothetical protein
MQDALLKNSTIADLPPTPSCHSSNVMTMQIRFCGNHSSDLADLIILSSSIPQDSETHTGHIWKMPRIILD